MCELFQRERSVITKRIGNIFKEGELEEKSNVQILHISGSDRPVKFYFVFGLPIPKTETRQQAVAQFKWTERRKINPTDRWTIEKI